MRIYPVTKLSPASAEIHEKTCLPFGFVVQPFARFKSQKNSRSNKDGSKEEEANVVGGGSSSHEVPVIKSYLVPKCTHCGSPINPSTYFIGEFTALCPFCRKDFRVDYESQHRRSKTTRSRNNIVRKEKYLDRLSRRRYLEERRSNIIEYDLPLLSVTGSNGQSKEEKEVFSLPVAMCPPLLTILIDGTSKNPKYYHKICSSLQSLLACGTIITSSSDPQGGGGTSSSSSTNIDFKGRRIGIFVMGSEGSLSVFDLKSPNAHLKHVWVNFSESLKPNPKFKSSQKCGNSSKITWNSVIPLSDVMDVENIYVPLDSEYSRSCIESAIRVLADSTILNQICLRNEESSTSTTVMGEPYLGSTIRYLLDYFDDVAYHPGMYQSQLNKSSNAKVDSCDDASQKFLYAGGKFLCFLASPPKEIGTTSFRLGKVGTGGFGGTCAEVGKRFSDSPPQTGFKDDTSDATIDDIELGGSSKIHKAKSSICNADDSFPQTAFSRVDDYYQNLGADCSYSAHSVEVFGLVEESKNGEGTHLGFPYLRLLSDRSGGNGPILVSLSQEKQDNVIEKEVLSRSTLFR